MPKLDTAQIEDAVHPVLYHLDSWTNSSGSLISLRVWLGDRETGETETAVTIDLDRRGAQELINALQHFVDPKIRG